MLLMMLDFQEEDEKIREGDGKRYYRERGGDEAKEKDAWNRH